MSVAPGDVYGCFTLIEAVSSGTRGIAWRVKCQCGREIVRNHYRLAKEPNVTCGRACPLAQKRAWEWLYLLHQQQSAKREIVSTIRFDIFVSYSKMDCFYCRDSAKRPASCSVATNTLDRVNNERGYEDGNIVAACWPCNRMKGSMSYTDFICHIEKLVRNVNKLTTAHYMGLTG